MCIRDRFDAPVEPTTIRTKNHNYLTISTKVGRADLVKKLLAQPRICFDTETTGLDPREAMPLGISFSYEAGKATYVTIPGDPAMAQAVLEEFRPVFENEAIEKVGHNLKYDVTLLKWHGIEVHGKLFDTMLAHSMKEPEMQHGLDYLSKLYLGYEPIPTSELLGPKGEEQRNMRDVPVEIVAEYACEDADVTLQVADKIEPDLVLSLIHISEPTRPY